MAENQDNSKAANVFQCDRSPHRPAECPQSHCVSFSGQFSLMVLLIDFVPISWVKGGNGIKGVKIKTCLGGFHKRVETGLAKLATEHLSGGLWKTQIFEGR